MCYDDHGIFAELGTKFNLQELRRETDNTPWQIRNSASSIFTSVVNVRRMPSSLIKTLLTDPVAAATNFSL